MNIYVGNLPYSATDADLREAFAQYGDVSNVQLISDKFTGGIDKLDRFKERVSIECIGCNGEYFGYIRAIILIHFISDLLQHYYRP